ncbi:MAG: hypothetical protein FWB92_08255 [Oscillospiraceae bacterium]|nr:hypothetical protein [Oscillospiraceae bacterium]
MNEEITTQITESTATKSCKFKITAQHWQGAVAMLLVVVMTVSALVLTPGVNLFGTLAANPNPGNIDYLMQDGKRVGIMSITTDGITFYDVYGGVQTTPSSTIQFYRDILTNEDYRNSGASPLHYWSQLAFLIFSEHAQFTSRNGNDSIARFETMWGRSSGVAGSADLVADFQRPGAGSRRDGRKVTSYTGLAFANSLSDVRLVMANSIASGIGRKVTGADVLDKTDGDRTLEAINDDTPQDVLYTIVTAIQTGAGYKYHYNSFGIAFYDFRFSPIVDDNLVFITAAEGEDSVEAAAAKNIPGVRYTVIESRNPSMKFFENRSSTMSEVTAEYSQGERVEITNSLSTTHTDSFSQTVGQSITVSSGEVFPSLSTTVSVSLTAQQMFSFTDTYSTTVSQDNTHTARSHITLPGHTVVGIKTSESVIEESLDYNSPVAVSFKVAIFSLSGDVYDDNAAVQEFRTAQYWQKHFTATFGNRRGSARAELRDRLRANRNVPAYESANNFTFGWRDKRVDGKSAWTMNELNWNSILARKAVSGSGNLRNGQQLTDWMMDNNPMSAFGANITSIVVGMNSEIQEIMPMYPLRFVRFGDSNSGELVYNLSTGETSTINITDLRLRGYNEQDVLFHGFNDRYGSFVLLDENKNEIDSSDILSFTASSGANTLTLRGGTGEGVVFLKYVIDNNVYTSHTTPGNYANNSNLFRTAYLRIVVTEERFDGSVELANEIIGTVGDVIHLSASGSPVTAHVFDATGREIRVNPEELVWEQRLLGRISIEGDVLTLEEVGTNEIRVNFKGIRSEWVSVTIEAAQQVLIVNEEPHVITDEEAVEPDDSADD